MAETLFVVLATELAALVAGLEVLAA